MITVGEHSQDAGAGAHVQNDIARLDDFADRGSEGVRAETIAHHPPLQFDVTVRLQIVVHDTTQQSMPVNLVLRPAG